MGGGSSLHSFRAPRSRPDHVSNDASRPSPDVHGTSPSSVPPWGAAPLQSSAPIFVRVAFRRRLVVGGYPFCRGALSMTLGLGTSLSTTTPNSADVLHIATDEWLPRPLLAGNCGANLSAHVMVHKATGLQRWASQAAPPNRSQEGIRHVPHPAPRWFCRGYRTSRGPVRRRWRQNSALARKILRDFRRLSRPRSARRSRGPVPGAERHRHL